MEAVPTQKQIRSRALRLRRALVNEAKEHGGIDDGAGKRYMIGPLFVQCGDLDAALAHYSWFEESCPDDTGEPIHVLFWALALFRAGDTARATDKLLETMIRNIYLLPSLIGQPVEAEAIWHSSNWEDPGYFEDASPEFVPSLTDEERSWIGAQLESDRFQRVRGEYVSTFRALKDERDMGKRRAILREWHACRANARNGSD
jgi:hypothetical protein